MLWFILVFESQNRQAFPETFVFIHAFYLLNILNSIRYTEMDILKVLWDDPKKGISQRCHFLSWVHGITLLTGRSREKGNKNDLLPLTVTRIPTSTFAPSCRAAFTLIASTAFNSISPCLSDFPVQIMSSVSFLQH